MKTIQSKILFVVIMALIVITAMVTAIAVTITHEIMHNDADRILNNISQKEAAEINEMLHDFMKSSGIMEHYASHELESIEALEDEEYFKEYIYNLRHLFDEIAINTSGTSSYYFCFSPKLTSNTSGFYIKLNESGEMLELSQEEFAGLSLITEEEFLEYSNLGGASVGTWVQPHPSRFTGEDVISYVVPIFCDETFLGILGFNMEFDYLLDRVNNIDVYDYGCALLLSEDKTTYYNITDSADFDGEYTEAVVPLACGMSLELRAAYKDIQSGIRPMLTHIVFAFLIVFALAILYTFWVTHKIVTPLKKLTQAAGNISTATQSVDLIVDSNDEIGILSRVLSDTYEKIREYSSYINALAYRDSLTGIKNSTAYSEAIEQYNKEINRGNPNFGVIVADINNLKKTNDSYGHDIGNELIVQASKILTDVFKTSSVFRIGGDEFVVILVGRDLENYRALIEKMDSAFGKAYIPLDDVNVPVSIARGVAIFDASIDHIYNDVFGKADHAMYMNKEEMKSFAV